MAALGSASETDHAALNQQPLITHLLSPAAILTAAPRTSAFAGYMGYTSYTSYMGYMGYMSYMVTMLGAEKRSCNSCNHVTM